MKFQETTTEMENKNKYQDAPKHYLLCYNTACKKAKTCLRQIVACENINKEKIVQCVNPSVNGGENCDYYKADRIVRIAYGMEHTFDKYWQPILRGYEERLLGTSGMALTTFVVMVKKALHLLNRNISTASS